MDSCTGGEPLELRNVDALLRPLVASGELPGVAYAILRGGHVIARNWLGWADREAREPLGPRHLYRIFSGTKLVTSCAVLQLVERHRLGLDDPIGEYLPQLANLRALRPASLSLDETETAQPVRIRHLLTHTAGFSYAFLKQQPLAAAYAAARISDPAVDLAGMVDALSRLPLAFQPGTAWNYSVATDVLGRLLEVVSGQSLDACLHRQVLEPLGLRETFFQVPPSHAGRLAALYESDPDSAPKALRRADHIPYPGAYRRPARRLNAGGGLVSSLQDIAKLLGALQCGGGPLLRSGSMPLVMQNQLAPGQWIGFPDTPVMPGRGHSFAASVTVRSRAWDGASAPGDLQWGGLAGTRWLISPSRSLAIVLMTQRYRVDDVRLWNALREAVHESFES